MEIHVTQEDIDNGHANTIDDCPIAIAVRRKMGLSYAEVVTGPTCGEVAWEEGGAAWEGGEVRVVPLPFAAQEFGARFDGGMPVSPFTFTLEV